MDVVNHYAKEGLRIISVAYKDVKVKNYKEFIKYNRSRAESELIFCGFVFLKNRLKESTAHTIGVLNAAKIVPYMATGDHMQTAIAVGKECCMIENETEVGTVRFNRHKELEIDFRIKTNRMKELKVL